MENIIAVLQLLPKQMQALHSDAVFYLSNENLIAIEERKTLIEKDIEYIRKNLLLIEEEINKL
jgi:hypothetical protein